MGIIYQLTCKPNGKRYVGKTKNTLEWRWYHHKKHAEYGRSRSLVTRSIAKYGPENFSLDILEETDNLNEREMFWIEQIQPELNLTKGGDGGWIYDQTGNRWTVKDSSRMGRGMLGKTLSEERKAKVAGKNNYQSKYVYHTPWGKFFTLREAVKQAKSEKHSVPVITDEATIKKYCNGYQIPLKGRRTPLEWRGKNSKEIGFDKTRQKQD